ncbi:MAG TPA: hypothetical protein EYP88_03725 [Anaerolineales bacterium]|nr:hypothetical protein [Anaerolineales bacterium]
MHNDDDFYDNDRFFNAESQPPPGIPLFLLIGITALGLTLLLSWVGAASPAIAAESALSGEQPVSGVVIAPFFTPEVQYWAGQIAIWSKKTGIDPNLIATVMQIESCGDPQATSGAGAMGLFQVMPFHFAKNENPYAPDVNAQRGLDYLRQALDARDGVVQFGLAGYNGGISGAQRPESQWAAETQRYVYWGTGIYKDALKQKDSSTRLNEWLNHGGYSLCAQAAQRLGISR